MTKLSSTYPIAMNFDQHPITVLTDESGAPWWFADEVCAALGIADHKSSARFLDEDERGVHTVHTSAGPRQKATINESGLYSLILRSRKPEAKRFKKWVTSEVLPAIRQTGTYGTPTLAAETRAVIAELRAEHAELRALVLSRLGQSTSTPALPSAPRTVPDWIVRLSERVVGDTHAAMTYAQLCQALDPVRVWTRSDKIWLGRHIAHHGERVIHNNIRAFCVRVLPAPASTRPVLLAPRRETGPFDRAALPAPRKLVEGVNPLGKGVTLRVRGGVPSWLFAPDDADAKAVENHFRELCPGFHLVPDRYDWLHDDRPPITAWKSKYDWTFKDEDYGQPGWWAKVAPGRCPTADEWGAARTRKTIVATPSRNSPARRAEIKRDFEAKGYKVGPWAHVGCGTFEASILAHP